jgi:hypothetical protein
MAVCNPCESPAKRIKKTDWHHKTIDTGIVVGLKIAAVSWN